MSARLQKVIEALQRGDRRAVAALLAEELRESPSVGGEHWANVEGVANRVGEIAGALEAARRYSLTEPRTLDRVLHYCHALAARGRIDACLRELDALPPRVHAHPEVLALRGSLAMRTGDLERAADLARQAIATSPANGRYWWALAMVHKFSSGDADLARMQELLSGSAEWPALSRAAFHFALGKARHECRDHEGAFAAWSTGAAALRAPFDRVVQERFVQSVIADFTPQSLAQLTPSGCDSQRAIFVTGLPRSGTTLVEQILTSHSAVTDGEEVNLFCCALMPAGDFSLRGGLGYQQRASQHPGTSDPWGDIARDYLSMLDQRFGREGHIVDKTLNHSRFLGFILHALPMAKVVWLRRDPEDTALSCFRSFFDTGTLPWCWSLADIGWHFRLEDALYEHWSRVFAERILTVPYESLVRDPASWIPRVLAHVGLEPEAAVFTPHLQARQVQTASAAQIRAPITTSSVGVAKHYHAHLQPFRDAYLAKRST